MWPYPPARRPGSSRTGYTDAHESYPSLPPSVTSARLYAA